MKVSGEFETCSTFAAEVQPEVVWSRTYTIDDDDDIDDIDDGNEDVFLEEVHNLSRYSLQIMDDVLL